MAPKLQTRVKEIIGAPNDDEVQVILNQWADNLTRYKSKAKEIADACADNTTDSKATETQAFIDENLEEYRAELFKLSQDVCTIKQSIQIRIPEIKEEDNLNGFESQLTSGSAGDKGQDKAAILPLAGKREYHGARAAIEEKMNPVGKDAEPSKAPSYQRQLNQLDMDIATRMSLSWSALHRATLNILVAYSNNQKKLVAPRIVSDRSWS